MNSNLLGNFPIIIIGDTVQVVYSFGSDTTPLASSSTYKYNTFTGFRI